MKNMNDMSDKELSELFAEKVAGWNRKSGMGWHNLYRLGEPGDASSVPDFATSVEAIMPWLNEYPYWFADKGSGGFEVSIESASDGSAWAIAETFPRAACFAILKEKTQST